MENYFKLSFPFIFKGLNAIIYMIVCGIYGIEYLIDNTLCIFLIMYRPICGELNQSQLTFYLQR